jgi:tetratricopeptide (TPR) repeat protein
MAETTLRDALRLAEDDIGASRPADALTRCHHILTHYPEMLEARRVLGEAYLALSKTREAYQAFDRVLVSDPENTLAYCGRALIGQELGDFDSALDCYYQACELSLGNRQLRLEFRRLANQANQPDFVLSRVGLARLYMRGDLLTHAIREWEQVLQGDPERVDARIGLAEALWRDGQAARAAAQCRLILQAIPSCLKALLLLGEIAYRAGQTSEANHYLDQARRLDPDGRMARELFADALISDQELAAFILAEPARIPVMAERPGDTSALPGPTSQSHPLIEQQSNAAETEEAGLLSSGEAFSFAFLTTGESSDGPPLREGESLEEMLASLIERPARPENSPSSALASMPAPASQPADRLQALLKDFSQPGETVAASPAASGPLNNIPEQRSPTTGPLGPKNAAVATTDFAEALFWLDTANYPSDAPGASSPQDQPAHDKAALQERGDTGSALLRPRREDEWSGEEDTEAGWLRWLQAQGARSLDDPGELPEESGAFAALLHPASQAAAPRTRLWEAPDPEFVRSFWPSDTVPQPVVRLAPGSSAKSAGTAQREAWDNTQRERRAQGDDAGGLSGISSVSLRPLTLEELERTFSASGLTRLEETLAGPASDRSTIPPWGQEGTEADLLTIAEDDYPARLELAERQRKTGRLDEALGHYRAIIRGAPELIDRVITGLVAATGEGPEQAAVYRLLGDAYTRRGDYMEALEAYNRGLAASRGQ